MNKSVAVLYLPATGKCSDGYKKAPPHPLDMLSSFCNCMGMNDCLRIATLLLTASGTTQLDYVTPDLTAIFLLIDTIVFLVKNTNGFFTNPAISGHKKN